jgi:addiction module RelE/StbE family toxin
VKRSLLPTKAFNRSAKRLAAKNPEAAEDIRVVLGLLMEDAFDPKLKTHKLKGRFSGCWACSAGDDLRIIFEFVRYRGAEAILLEAVGSHDEVY